MRNRSLRHEERRPQVEIERRIPTLGRDLLDRLAHHNRRGVDQDVEPFQDTRGLVGKSSRASGSLRSAWSSSARLPAPRIARAVCSAPLAEPW